MKDTRHFRLDEDKGWCHLGAYSLVREIKRVYK